MARRPQELADLLHAAREREGLSKRELASRLGLSRATIREIEEGRDLRWSTLETLARQVPGLSPDELLPCSETRVPPLGGKAWRRQRELLGASAKRLVRTLRPAPDGGVDVEDSVVDARWHGRATSKPLEALLHRLHVGPRAPLMRALAAESLEPGTELAFEAGPVSWSYTVSGSATSPRVSLRRCWRITEADAEPATLEAARRSGCLIVPELPVERIEIVKADAVGDWTALLHPRSLALSESAAEAYTRAAGVAGGAPRVELSDGAARARFEQVAVGHACSLVALAGGDRDGRRSVTGRTVLRRARESAGLSARELGRRAGISAQTLSGAEAGASDARRSRLLSLLEALPQLSPWSLLPWPDATSDAEALHGQQRALFGCELEEEHKEVEISKSGSLRIRIHFRGLRRTRAGEGDLALVLGASRSVLQERSSDLDALSETGGETAGLRISRRAGHDAPDQFVLRVPAEAALRGVSFSRRFMSPGSHVMTAARARELTGQEGPFHEGTSFGPIVPANRSVLTVRFPRGYRPEDLRATAWSMGSLPDPEGPDLSDRLGPAAPTLDWDPKRRLARLESVRAPVGLKLALSWRLP